MDFRLPEKHYLPFELIQLLHGIHFSEVTQGCYCNLLSYFLRDEHIVPANWQNWLSRSQYSFCYGVSNGA